MPRIKINWTPISADANAGSSAAATAGKLFSAAMDNLTHALDPVMKAQMAKEKLAAQEAARKAAAKRAGRRGGGRRGGHKRRVKSSGGGKVVTKKVATKSSISPELAAIMSKHDAKVADYVEASGATKGESVGAPPVVGNPDRLLERKASTEEVKQYEDVSALMDDAVNKANEAVQPQIDENQEVIDEANTFAPTAGDHMPDTVLSIATQDSPAEQEPTVEQEPIAAGNHMPDTALAIAAQEATTNEQNNTITFDQPPGSGPVDPQSLNSDEATKVAMLNAFGGTKMLKDENGIPELANVKAQELFDPESLTKKENAQENIDKLNSKKPELFNSIYNKSLEEYQKNNPKIMPQEDKTVGDNPDYARYMESKFGFIDPEMKVSQLKYLSGFNDQILKSLRETNAFKAKMDEVRNYMNNHPGMSRRDSGAAKSFLGTMNYQVKAREKMVGNFFANKLKSLEGKIKVAKTPEQLAKLKDQAEAILKVGDKYNLKNIGSEADKIATLFDKTNNNIIKTKQNKNYNKMVVYAQDLRIPGENALNYVNGDQIDPTKVDLDKMSDTIEANIIKARNALKKYTSSVNKTGKKIDSSIIKEMKETVRVLEKAKKNMHNIHIDSSKLTVKQLENNPYHLLQTEGAQQLANLGYTVKDSNSDLSNTNKFWTRDTDEVHKARRKIYRGLSDLGAGIVHAYDSWDDASDTGDGIQKILDTPQILDSGPKIRTNDFVRKVLYTLQNDDKFVKYISKEYGISEKALKNRKIMLKLLTKQHKSKKRKH